MSGQRIVVTSPRTGAARVRGRWPVSRELGEQTELGAVLLSSLMRAQLRQAWLTCGVVVGVTGIMPVLFAVVPWLARGRVAGVPVSWLVLGLCVQPVWIVVSFWQVRRAERLEDEFTRVVERS